MGLELRTYWEDNRHINHCTNSLYPCQEIIISKIACQLWLCNHGNILHQHQDRRQQQWCGQSQDTYMSRVTGLFFIFSIYYYLLYWWLFTEDNPLTHRPPPQCVSTFMHHHQHQHCSQKKNTLDMTPLGMEAWQESLVGFIYILLFFFLYYRWYLLLQLSQWQRLPFHSPVPSSSSLFGLWKVVMAKIGPNDARCVVWAFSKLFYFYFYFFFHVQLTLTIIFR